MLFLSITLSALLAQSVEPHRRHETVSAEQRIPLTCTPLPACVARLFSRAAGRKLGVRAWDGHGTAPSPSPERVETRPGYVDLATSSWVPLEGSGEHPSEGPQPLVGAWIQDDPREIRLLGHRASPLVALGIRPDDAATVEGFGADFTSWRVIDLRTNTLLLELTSSDGTVLAVGPAAHVRVRLYAWSLPRECPGWIEPQLPSPQLPARALPRFAVEATWDLLTGRRTSPLEAWESSFELGEQRLGLCRAPEAAQRPGPGQEQ